MAVVRPELTLLVIALLALLPSSQAQAAGFQYTVLQCTFPDDFAEAVPNQDAANSLKAGFLGALNSIGIPNAALAVGEPFPRGSDNSTAIQLTVSDIANGQSVYTSVATLTEAVASGGFFLHYDPSDNVTSNATLWLWNICVLGGFLNGAVGVPDCGAIPTAASGPWLPTGATGGNAGGPTGGPATGPAGPVGGILGARLSLNLVLSSVAPDYLTQDVLKASLAAQILTATGYEANAIHLTWMYGFQSTTHFFVDFLAENVTSAEEIGNEFLTAISGDFGFNIGGSSYPVFGACRSNPVVLALLQLPTCEPDMPVDPSTTTAATSSTRVPETIDEELLFLIATQHIRAENLADIQRQQFNDALYWAFVANPQPQAASLVTILQDNGLVPAQPDLEALAKASLMLVDAQKLAEIQAAHAEAEYHRYQPIDEYLLFQIASGMLNRQPTEEELSAGYWAYMNMKMLQDAEVSPTKEEAIYDLLHPVYSRVTREHTAQMARLMWDDFNCNYPDGNTQGNLIYCETSQNTYVIWQFMSYLNLGPPVDPNKELGEWTCNFVDDWHVEWTYVWSPSTASGNSLSVGLTVFGVILAVIGIIGIVVAVALMSSRAAKERHNRRISTAHLSTPVKMQSLPRESWVEGIDV